MSGPLGKRSSGNIKPWPLGVTELAVSDLWGDSWFWLCLKCVCLFFLFEF